MPRGGRQAGVMNRELVDIELKPGELTDFPFGSIIIVKGDPLASFEASPSGQTGGH
jgi:hypothetical protein